MDSSSDDSFAWTDASSDHSDSDTMVVNNTAKNQSDGESEYGKSYKKKLQQDLFSNNQEDNVSHEALKQKDRKRKVNQHPEETNMESLKKKRIKLERERDLMTSETKTMPQDTERSVSIDDAQLMSTDESYLNMRVKQEQSFASPSPVKSKKKRSKSICNSSCGNAVETDLSNITPTNKFDVNEDFTNDEISDISHPIHSEETHIKVKKKKKKSKKRNSYSEVGDKDDNMIIEDKFCAEETVVEMRQVNRNNMKGTEGNSRKDEILHKNKHSNNTERRVSAGENSTEKHDEGKHKLNNNLYMNENESTHVEDSTEERSPSHSIAFDTMVRQNGSLSNQPQVPERTNQRLTRISDRIRYEDEVNSDADGTVSNDKGLVTKSRKLKNFLKCHGDLKPVLQQLINGSILTHDDEIWAMKCPHDTDVNAFQDLKLFLDKKSKIKLGDNTYDASITEEAGKLTVLSMKHTKFVVKNLPLNGLLNFRKRVPKVHIREDNIMTNNQTDFIPLPETKCRHPLFGSNYKKAIKIPKAITERIKYAEHNESLSTKTGKKKKKKHKNNASETEIKLKYEPNTETEPEIQLAPSTMNKNKKRKHVCDDESPPVNKSKRMKHDPDSAEVWDSEKAIEESLFKF